MTKRVNTIIPDAVFNPPRRWWYRRDATHKPILWVNGRMRVLNLKKDFHDMAFAMAFKYAEKQTANPKSPLFGYKVRRFRSNTERHKFLSGWSP